MPETELWSVKRRDLCDDMHRVRGPRTVVEERVSASWTITRKRVECNTHKTASDSPHWAGFPDFWGTLMSP